MNKSQNQYTLSDLLQDKFDSWVVKRTTSLFNSFCANLLRVLSKLMAMQLHEDKVEALEHCIHSFNIYQEITNNDGVYEEEKKQKGDLHL